MFHPVSIVLGAVSATAVSLLGTPLAMAQTAPAAREVESSFDTVDAPVLKVFSAEQDGHRFVAYLVEWNDSEVIVSDPLGGSTFQEGDEIRFLAQKIDLPRAGDDVSTLNFVLLTDPSRLNTAEDEPLAASATPAEQKRQMEIIGGNLDAAKTPEERFYALNRAAKDALESGNAKEAQALANELLQIAQTRQNDWNYGNAIQDGNQVLGRIALAQGELEEAKRRLLASADSKGSPQMNSFGPNMQLAKALLAKGEKEVVLQYFDRCGEFWEMGSAKLSNWTNAVNNGQTPQFGANLNY
jgi:hypothetical protein